MVGASIQMITAKTHYEQVPLKIVKKIIERQENREKPELASAIKAPKSGRNKFWQQPFSEEVPQ